MDELFYCLELFAAKARRLFVSESLDDAYFTNFVSLARKVAPDRDSVRWVSSRRFEMARRGT